MFFRIILLLFLVLSGTLKAQLRHMFDSIGYDLKQEKRIFLSLDGKNSVIRDLPIKLMGIQLGYLYNRRTNLYLGLYGSYNDERDYLTFSDKSQAYRDTYTVKQKFHLSYFNIGCEYYFKDTRRWRFSIPFSIGSGSGTEIRYTKFKELFNEKKHVFPTEIGITAKYKLTWWLWISSGLGARVTLGNTSYSGSYYSLGLSVKFGEIYRRFKTWYKARD